MIINLRDLVDCEKKAVPLVLGGAVQFEKRNRGDRAVDVLTGRAAVFEEFTPMIDRWGDEFQEKFAKECMDETLADGHKIMALFSHDWTALMGSTSDNLKLELKVDGLYFEFVPKSFEFDKRIVELIKSGTIGGCSIGYRVLENKWEEKDGEWFRIIEKIELYEMSFTPIPAYEQTSVEVREAKAERALDAAPEVSDEERSKIIRETEEILARRIAVDS